MYFFNIVKEFVYFPSCLAIMPVALPYARNNIHQYRIPFAHCDDLKYSFTHVTIPLWNNLPIDALSADTLPMFKYFVSPLFL